MSRKTYQADDDDDLPLPPPDMPPPSGDEDEDLIPAPVSKSKSTAPKSRSGGGGGGGGGGGSSQRMVTPPSTGKDAFLSMMDPSFLAAAGISMSRTPQQAAQSINPDLKIVDSKSPSGRNCGACNKSLAGVEGIHALGKNWHYDCWVCFHCRKQLGQSKFVTRLEKPFCDDICSRKQICGGCRKLIGQAKNVEAFERRYHTNCFRCANCNTLLTGDTYAVRSDDPTHPYCETHAMY